MCCRERQAKLRAPKRERAGAKQRDSNSRYPAWHEVSQALQWVSVADAARCNNAEGSGTCDHVCAVDSAASPCG
jgi:hypothetical protein